MSNYDKHILHWGLGSVSSETHSSMFPTSWIICFDSWLKGLNDWLCSRSRWRACRFGWFSIFWINSRTLTLCSCFTVECGSPGILKFMSSSILSRINFFVERLDLMINFKVVLYCDVVFIRLLWSIMSLLNSDILVFFRRTCLNTVHVLRVIGLPWSNTDWFFVIGWVGWKNFARLATSSCNCRTISLSGCWSTVEANETSLAFQSWRSGVFGGGRGDMNAFSYKASPVFSLTTFRIQ